MDGGLIIVILGLIGAYFVIVYSWAILKAVFTGHRELKRNRLHVVKRKAKSASRSTGFDYSDFNRPNRLS